MIINALLINTPTSPHISLETYLPPRISQLESSSTDDESDDDHQPISNLNNTENDIITWHDQLAKSLISLHHDMHVIITGFDEMSQNTEGDVHEKKTKLELMRMALMLNPTDLPTCNNEEPTSPYADLKQLDDLENPSIEKQPYQHENLRLKIHRLMSRLKRGMEKLRLILFSSSYQHRSSCYTNNYRKRMEKSLSEIRENMIEYNRVNTILEEEKQDDELTKHQKTINHIITKVVTRNPLIEERIEDYRTKLKGKGCKAKYELISSPLIRLQSESNQNSLSVEDKGGDNILCLKPLDFPDLKHAANEFFDSEPLTSSNL